MSSLKNKIAFIVPTKDRPKEIRNMLKSFEKQTQFSDQIIVVDGGIQQINEIVNEFPKLNIKYLRCIPPSAARQRNMGIKAVNPEITLIGFLDDDTVLEVDALKKIMDFWEKAPEDIGGAALNMVNHPPLYASWFKSLPLTEKLGLYSKEKGKVLPSGFHTMIGFVSETTFVQWLPTCATVWRRKILDEFQFDEWFEGYSYLEDLDFSYQIGKEYRLAVVADARYYHYPFQSGRADSYLFGKKEAINRLYFVKKHGELSPQLCYLALFARILLNFGLGFFKLEKNYFKRLWGNCVGLFNNGLKYFQQGRADVSIIAKAGIQTKVLRKIVILASAIGPTNRGIGQYERHLLSHLLPRLIARGCQISLILSKDALLPPSQDEIKYIRLPADRDKTILKFFAEQIYISYFSWGADVFLSLESAFPFVPIRAKRKLVVVHDIHVIQHLARPEQYPEDYTWKYKFWANLATKKAISSSDRVITVSKFTGDEIQRMFGLTSNRIVNIPNGVDHGRFHSVEDPAMIEQVRKRYALPPSFYLFVGPYSRKKNLRIIVEAYASVAESHDIVLPVVVVGDMRRSQLYADTLALIERTNKKDLFLFLGVVLDNDLPLLYAAARAFLYPSLYEGFGLPALEAMACGTPVIASNQTSIPEVVADAALLIDPTRPESLIDALQKVNEESTRRILIEKGLQRAKAFSWERTAELMIDAILY